MKAGAPLPWKTASILILGFLGLASASIYTNHFLVEFHKGGEADAQKLAAEYGFHGVRKVRSSLSFFLTKALPRSLFVHDDCRIPPGKVSQIHVHVFSSPSKIWGQEFSETLGVVIPMPHLGR